MDDAPTVRGGDTVAGDDERELDELGPYEIIERVGKGGQGVVYLAKDRRLGRQVALKVLGEFSREGLKRFQREAEVASRLDHPGICTIYDSGQHDGSWFIAMRFVEGEPLSAQIHRARYRVDDSEAVAVVQIPGSDSTSLEKSDSSNAHRKRELLPMLRFFERTARALHMAHEAGLIHRDIKPGNVMVTQRGDPVLLDFGLARDLENDGQLTAASAMVGTPDYMSPEQVQPKHDGRRRTLDRRTDVYSLGVTMFECITLHRPFDAPNWAVQFQKILHGDLPNPARYNPLVSRDLRAVLEKAVDKDPERRYATAADFAEELRRIRENEPIHAKPIGPIGRTVKWAHRNPRLAIAFAGLVVASIVLLVMLLVLLDTHGKLEQQRAAAAEARLRAARDSQTAFRAARLLMQQGRFEDALAEYDRALELGYVEAAEIALGKVEALVGARRLDEARTALAEIDPGGDRAHAAKRTLLEGDLTPTSPAHADAGLDSIRRALATGDLAPADAAFARALLGETIDEVIREVSAARTLDRHHRRANETWGLVLLNTGRFEEAREFSRTYQTLYPNDPTGTLLRAVSLQQTDGEQAAQAELARLGQTIEPATFEAWSSFVVTFRLFEVFEQEMLKTLVAPTGPSQYGSHALQARAGEAFADYLQRVFPPLCGRVVEGFQNGRHAVPQRLPLALSRAWDTFSATFQRLILSQQLSGEVESAMTIAIRHLPDGVFHVVRGHSRLIHGRVRDAADDYLRAAELDSMFGIRRTALTLAVHTLSQLAERHPAQRARRLEELRRSVAKLLAMGDQRAVLYRFCATRAADLGELDTALEVVDAWTRANAEDVDAWIHKSRLLGRLGRHFYAVDVAEQAARLAPSNREAARALTAARAALEAAKK